MIAPNNDGARKHSGRDGVSLRKFFDRTFAPTRLADACHSVRCWHSSAIVQFRSMLGRTPLVTDLRGATIDKQVRFLRRQGLAKVTISRHRQALRDMARDAWRAGLLDDVPDIAPNPPLRLKRRRKNGKLKKRQAKTYPTGTLAHWCRTQFRNNTGFCSSKSKGAQRRYCIAVSKFSVFLKRDATPDDLTTEQIAAFHAWASQSGLTQNVADNYRFAIDRMRRWTHGIPDPRMADELPPAEPGTVRHFFHGTFRPQRLIGTKPSTVDGYEWTLRKLYQFARRDVLLSELTDDFAARFMMFVRDELGRLPITVNRHRRQLFAIWRYAVELGLIDRDPRVRSLKETRDAPDAWSLDELRRLVAAPLQLRWENDIDGIPTGKYLHAILLVGYWTGLRRGSLWTIRMVDLDMESGWLHVPGAAMKNGIGKSFRLHPEAIAALRAIESDRRMIFPQGIWTTTFSKYMKRVIKRAKIPESRRRVMTQMHKLRRSTATLVAQDRGIAAAGDLLGHSSDVVTERYIDQSKMPGKDATQFLPQLTDFDADGSKSERTPAQFLSEAAQLASEGRHAAAAMTARIALERAAQDWFRAAIKTRYRGQGVNYLIHRLAKAGHLDDDQCREFKRAANVGNKAAHGGSVEPDKVAWLIDRVRAFLVVASAAE